MGDLTRERLSCGQESKSIGCTDMHFPTVEVGVSDDVRKLQQQYASMSRRFVFADGAARAAAARRAALVRLAIWASCVCWLVSQVCQLVCCAERVDAAARVGCLCERRGCLCLVCRVCMAEGVSCSASMLLAACLPALSHFTSSRHPRHILQRSLKPTLRPRSGELPCCARLEVCASGEE